MEKEDFISVFIQDLKDIQSSLKVLHIAVGNEFDPPSMTDIDNMLEILLSKYSSLVTNANKLTE